MPRPVSEIAAELISFGRNLSQAPLGDYARTAGNEAAGRGRQTGVASIPEEPVRIYASEVLDRRTCPACYGIDGKEYATVAESLQDYPAGGYVECDGGPRCRGTRVFVWATETPPSNQAPGDALPPGPGEPGGPELPGFGEPGPPPEPEPIAEEPAKRSGSTDVADWINSSDTSTFYNRNQFEETFTTHVADKAEVFADLQRKLRSWTGGRFKAVKNEVSAILKGEKVGSAGSRKIIELVDAASADSPPLFRGMSLTSKPEKFLESLGVAGDELDMTLSSFTSDRRVVTRFLSPTNVTGEGAKSNTQVIFRLEQGSKSLKVEGLGHPDFYGEREWITGGRFEIVKVKRKGSLIDVTIRQIGTYGLPPPA